LAVLYFSNLSQDSSLDWLNRGLAEMLTTNLAQVKGLDVISTERNSRRGRAPGDEGNGGAQSRLDGEGGAQRGRRRVYHRHASARRPKRLRLDVQVQDTRSGQVLFSDKVEAADVQGICSTVDAVTGRVAQRFAPAAFPPDHRAR
jgi:TolB-like protein